MKYFEYLGTVNTIPKYCIKSLPKELKKCLIKKNLILYSYQVLLFIGIELECIVYNRIFIKCVMNIDLGNLS